MSTIAAINSHSHYNVLMLETHTKIINKNKQQQQNHHITSINILKIYIYVEHSTIQVPVFVETITY